MLCHDKFVIQCHSALIDVYSRCRHDSCSSQETKAKRTRSQNTKATKPVREKNFQMKKEWETKKVIDSWIGTQTQ